MEKQRKNRIKTYDFVKKRVAGYCGSLEFKEYVRAGQKQTSESSSSSSSNKNESTKKKVDAVQEAYSK